jgi:hypothetical protein
MANSMIFLGSRPFSFSREQAILTLVGKRIGLTRNIAKDIMFFINFRFYNNLNVYFILSML